MFQVEIHEASSSFQQDGITFTFQADGDLRLNGLAGCNALIEQQRKWCCSEDDLITCDDSKVVLNYAF